MTEHYHRPVLLEEVVEAMNIREDGYYLDATAGRGGHVAAVLEQLGPKGRILAIYRDPQEGPDLCRTSIPQTDS